MKAKIVFLSTALSAALGAASTAQAADSKVYPGNACQVDYGSLEDRLIHLPNFIGNASAGSLFVTCPIVRDNPGNLNGVESVSVRVQSLNAATLGCGLYSYSAFGALGASDQKSTASTTAVDLPLDIDISTKGGTYSLLCALPPGGRIHEYRVNEY